MAFVVLCFYQLATTVKANASFFTKYTGGCILFVPTKACGRGCVFPYTPSIMGAKSGGK